jgi:hypothetical protein
MMQCGRSGDVAVGKKHDTDPKYVALLADKAAKLEELQKRRPGQKGYRRSLAEFLEADAKSQKELLKWISKQMADEEAEGTTDELPAVSDQPLN